MQHYTNQLAKETNTYMKDLAHLPQPATQSDQVQLESPVMVTVSAVAVFIYRCKVINSVVF